MKFFKNQLKNNLIYKILQLFYGELSNKENSLKTKMIRIICRTPLKNIFYKIFILFNKNEKNQVNYTDIFQNEIMPLKALSDLKNHGIFKDIKIKSDIIEKINNEASNKFYKVNRSEKYIKINQKKKNDGIYIARLFSPEKEIKIINEIIFNNKIIDITKSYFNCEPIFHSAQIWWTFPFYDKNNNLQNPPGNEFGFHYDVDDLRFLKLFIYLSDVKKENGPHIYIKNSGKKTFNEHLNRRITDEFAYKNYKDNLIEIIGDNGTAFLEDTSFYHKGTNPISEKGRSLLQIVYVIKKWSKKK